MMMMRAARAGKQERHDLVELDRTFVGEGGDILTGHKIRTIAERDIDQRCRAMADGGNGATSFVNGARDAVDGRTRREIPHRAVATGKEDRRVTFRVYVGKTQRVANGVPEPFLVPVACIGCITEIEAVNRRCAAFDRGEIDGKSGRFEHREGVCDLAKVEAGRLPACSFFSMAGMTTDAIRALQRMASVVP